ncbi:MAG: hypothetical protein OXF90_08085 [Chloroflexi bacterium]|nr:hypothetical protein [Chloroflexota bacterium]
MSSNSPRIRGDSPSYDAPYPIGQIPDGVVLSIGKQIVHRRAVGMGDITGDDFGSIFADSIGGVHKASPVGIADVNWNGCAWSVKTVKAKQPFKQGKVRLISGRNSPDYSLGIENPRANISHTGRAVLSIWNQRVNAALDEHSDMRVMILIRNIETQEFVLFEEEAHRFVPDEYRWEENKRKNFCGYDRLTNKQRFTWQPHGSQFTVHRDVPHSARKFKITRSVPLVEPDVVLDYIQFRDNWVEIVG